MTSEDTNAVMTNVDHKLQINLLDNGIDFVLHGIDDLFEDEEFIFRQSVDAARLSMGNYKYGILNLFAGFLLLLKERLHRHLPELIFCGQLDDIRAKLSGGKVPNTVDFDTALERLAIGPRFVFSGDELKAIRCMHTVRNTFEHYHGEFNKYQLWSVITEFLAVIDRFLVDELTVRLEDAADEGRLVQKIHRIEAVWERQKRDHESAWRERMTERHLEFSANRDKIIGDFDATLYEMKGAYRVYITCPECGEDTLIAVGEYSGICANEECEWVEELTECAKCSETTPGSPYDSFPLCTSCEDWINQGESSD
jgi:hypothetical protein